MLNTIIVTGCSKRIGLNIVEHYLKTTGYLIIAIVRRISEDLDFLRSKYKK